MNMQEEKKSRYGRMALAVLAVVMVTALAVDAAVTRIKALHITPSLAHPGQILQGAVELSIPAPTGGVTIELRHTLHHRGIVDQAADVHPAAISLPRSIFIPAGKTTGLFNIDVLQVSEPANLIVKAKLNNTEQVFNVHLLPGGQ